MQLALAEMRLALAAFFRACKGARLEHTTDAMMAQDGEFFIVPKAGKCYITLKAEGQE